GCRCSTRSWRGARPRSWRAFGCFSGRCDRSSGLNRGPLQCEGRDPRRCISRERGKGTPNPALHLTRPTEVLFVAHRLVVVVTVVSAGQVSFPFGEGGGRCIARNVERQYLGTSVPVVARGLTHRKRRRSFPRIGRMKFAIRFSFTSPRSERSSHNMQP